MRRQKHKVTDESILLLASAIAHCAYSVMQLAVNVAESVEALLKVLDRRANTSTERAQIAWWRARIEELRHDQPSADAPAAAPAVVMGTGGGK